MALNYTLRWVGASRRANCTSRYEIDEKPPRSMFEMHLFLGLSPREPAMARRLPLVAIRFCTLPGGTRGAEGIPHLINEKDNIVVNKEQLVFRVTITLTAKSPWLCLCSSLGDLSCALLLFTDSFLGPESKQDKIGDNKWTSEILRRWR